MATARELLKAERARLADLRASGADSVDVNLCIVRIGALEAPARRGEDAEESELPQLRVQERLAVELLEGNVDEVKAAISSAAADGYIRLGEGRRAPKVKAARVFRAALRRARRSSVRAALEAALG